MKILVAYDSGEPARRALSLAADFAGRLEATVDVVSVVPVHTGRAPMDPWDDPVLHAEQLAEAGRFLRAQGIEPSLIRRFGEPSRVIEEVAAEGAYDLVVVGSRGLGSVGRFFQGSVSEHVATHSPTTVLIAR
jgi:nucleotide-binding universal stress UspA family protein